MQFLGEPQVNQLWKTLSIYHDVFGFEISKDYILCVEMANSIEHSCNVKHGCMVVEAPIARKPGEEFPSLDILEHHIDMLRILKGGFAE